MSEDTAFLLVSSGFMFGISGYGKARGRFDLAASRLLSKTNRPLVLDLAVTNTYLGIMSQFL